MYVKIITYKKRTMNLKKEGHKRGLGVKKESTKYYH